MTRPRFQTATTIADHALILGVIAALATLPASADPPTPPAAPALQTATYPNVLMIIIDDVAASIHSVGQPSPVQTPSIARLAARSTWFTRAYCDAPACCP